MTRPLRAGIVAPSGYVADTAVLDRAAARFAERGWQVQAGESCFAREERFAGPDALRAAELQGFASDRRLDLVLAARGGYGLTRILPHLDFMAIRAAARPVCGYSDFTAFNLAFLARAGGISLHGPSAMDFGAETPDVWTLEQFFLTLGSGELDLGFAADGPAVRARGVLWGGNLALVCALVGTPYLPRVRGGILFLEDVNEPAYRIERLLLQLEQAGILGRQRAILLGQFDPIPATPNDNGFDLGRVVAGLRARLAVPVLTGLPFGHVPRKASLPIGARVTLTAGDGGARLAGRWRENG
jgi:muramoyltetrapeptide carboxypeptidase